MIHLSWGVWVLIYLWYFSYRCGKSSPGGDSVKERQRKRHEEKAKRKAAARAERDYAEDLELRDLSNPPAGVDPERWGGMSRIDRHWVRQRRHR